MNEKKNSKGLRDEPLPPEYSQELAREEQQYNRGREDSFDEDEEEGPNPSTGVALAALASHQPKPRQELVPRKVPPLHLPPDEHVSGARNPVSEASWPLQDRPYGLTLAFRTTGNK